MQIKTIRSCLRSTAPLHIPSNEDLRVNRFDRVKNNKDSKLGISNPKDLKTIIGDCLIRNSI